MIHLNDNRIYDLAEKIETEAPFTAQDVEDLNHIAECEDCYRLLRSTMALIHVTSHMEDYAFAASSAAAVSGVRETISAAIRLVIDKVNGVLSQLDSSAGNWVFDTGLALAGSRSAEAEGPSYQLLEDQEDDQTFVAYDAERKLLCIQLAWEEDSPRPRAFLILAGGEKQEIPLEKRDDILWAEVHGLEEGEYQLILEK